MITAIVMKEHIGWGRTMSMEKGMTEDEMVGWHH